MKFWQKGSEIRLKSSVLEEEAASQLDWKT